MDSETYLAELVRYIHANPVQAGLTPRARAWPWSSHRHYLAAGPASRPGWLETAEVLARFGGDTKAGRAALDRLVHARVPEDVQGGARGRALASGARRRALRRRHALRGAG